MAGKTSLEWVCRLLSPLPLIALPPLSSDEGMIVRLLLAESLTPDSSAYREQRSVPAFTQ